MMLRGNSQMNLNGVSSKRLKMVVNGNWRPWSDLPEALLELIAKHLDMVHYLLFGCVCRSWKSFVEAYKKDFMAFQPPLILLISPHARRSYCFYNIFDHRICKVPLPALIGKSCYGVTGGYLVMQEKKKEVSPLWLVNPITRHELHFPVSPHRLDHVILASLTMPRGEFIVVGFSITPPVLQFCRSSDLHWTTYEFETPSVVNPWHITDGAFFKGKIYFLTSHGKIGLFDPSSTPYFSLLDVESIPHPSKHCMRLVASDEQLLVVKLRLFATDNQLMVVKKAEAYELNILMKSWTRVRALGDLTMFVGDIKGSLGLCTKPKWVGCQMVGSYILSVGSSRYSFTVLSVDRRSFQPIFIKPRNGMPTFSWNRAFWYFPHLACNVDTLCQ